MIPNFGFHEWVDPAVAVAAPRVAEDGHHFSKRLDGFHLLGE
jgi:hypothetical protein